MSGENEILAWDPDRLREIDGVVFDLDSYARNCVPPAPQGSDHADHPSIPVPEGILAMDPAHYRAIDGVAMDEESYARHCAAPAVQPPEPPPPAPQPMEPVGVFAADPVPDGWYPAENGMPPVPIMSGALPPVEVLEDGTHQVIVTHTVFRYPGSGSGSYLSSYTTSYTTSYRTSYLSSGSGSYRGSSCVCAAGGYGLELI